MTTPATEWFDRAQRRLEERLIEGQGSFSPMLFCDREGTTVAVILGDDGRSLCEISPICVAGFEADEIAFIADTYTAKAPTNPEGKRWERGEMGRRAHEPEVRALLSDALFVVHGLREQGLTVVTRTYSLNEAGGVTWGDVEVIPGADFGGPIFDSLTRAIAEQWMSKQVVELLPGTDLDKVFGFNAEQRLIRQRLVAVKYVIQQAARLGSSVAVALAAHEKDREVYEEFSKSRHGAGIEFEMFNPDA